jgi:hypothetical protein
MKTNLSQKTRLIIAFVILCVMTFGVLFTGPGFGFVWQVLIGSTMLFVLFWFIT